MENPDKFKNLIETRESEKARKCSIKYRNGTITVVIPEGRDIDVEKLIQKNQDFFDKYIPIARKFREKVPERDLSPGGEITLLGDKRRLKVEKRRSNKIDTDILLAEHLVERTNFIDQLEKCLRSFARRIFEDKASEYSEDISKGYNRIFIRDQRTRWGSCSSKGNLNFNWRLILGPEHVVEYVVVHELIHLEEKNHSKQFWNKVEQILPNYRESREWLEEESAKLVFKTSKY